MKMNLTVDPWIPAVRADGARSLFSLHDLFARAHELRDLAVKPHERIALMRLLLCVTQAALDGPEDEDDWEECRDRIQPRAKEYLDKWRAKFELFGDGERFLQAENLKTEKKSGEKTSVSKLDLALASGNNATLFDNASGEDRKIDAGRLAVNLLSFLCFTPSEIVGAGDFDGTSVPKRTGRQGPCAASSLVHTFVLGATVLETLWLNLFDREMVLYTYGTRGWGKPIWEESVHLKSSESIENATLSYLGRLVPISRLVKLDEDCQYISLADGPLEYRLLDDPKKPQVIVFREPHSTVLSNDDQPGFIRGDVSKSLWRELGAVITKRKGERSEAEGPIALSRRPRDRSVTVWMGSLISTKDKGIVDAVEGAYSVSPQLLSDWGPAFYESGLREANTQAGQLGGDYGACARYLHALSHPTLGEEEFNSAIGKLRRGEKQHLRNQLHRAEMLFWTHLESQKRILLNGAEDADLETWKKAVRAAAVDAYEQSCPRQTPRQIQAYALGLRRLNASPKIQSQDQERNIP